MMIVAVSFTESEARRLVALLRSVDIPAEDAGVLLRAAERIEVAMQRQRILRAEVLR